ncbi:hypothetical protein GCM10007199_04470 [Fictibacillus barbaricus]|nr:hypothetical protein GCM10007199_04470 [Fictibacillus barbaricus]
MKDRVLEKSKKKLGCSYFIHKYQNFLKSIIMEVLNDKEEMYMKNMTTQTVQTYKGGTRS